MKNAKQHTLLHLSQPQLSLKRRLFHHRNPLSVNGMAESQLLCMQIQTVGCMAVKLVSANGTVQPPRMRSMHPQLMRPPRERIESHPCVVVSFFLHFIFRQRFFPEFLAHYLMRPVERVQAEWESDASLFPFLRLAETISFWPTGIIWTKQF